MAERRLELQKLIAENECWEQMLREKPYCITVSRGTVSGRKLAMFRYSQADSDFTLPVVRECRGLILDAETYEVVCYPFEKFGNLGESYVPEIDWKTASVSQKLDGSLVKAVKLGSSLLLSTNGMLNAYDAPIAKQLGCKAADFGELFEEGLAFYGLDKAKLASMLQEGFTYMFELTSPFNKVVVPWHETKLNFIGVRDNVSFSEQKFFEHELAEVFNVPKLYPLKSFDDCIAAAEKLGADEEGFVVCDGKFNRVKVKSPAYCAMHHMRNNGVMTFERGIEIVRENELGEVLSCFPEFAELLNGIKASIDQLIESLECSYSALQRWIADNGYADKRWLIERGGRHRRDVAVWIQKAFKVPSIGFELLDGRARSANEWCRKIPASRLAAVLKCS